VSNPKSLGIVVSCTVPVQISDNPPHPQSVGVAL